MKVLKDKPFPRIVKIIVCTLKVIGLAPFSLQRVNNPSVNTRNDNSRTSVFLFSKIGMAYNILLAILFLITSAFALPELSSMDYPNKSPMSQAIDVTNGFLRTLTICVIIFSGAFQQRKKISILNRLLEVDCLLSGMDNHSIGNEKSFVSLVVRMILDALIWVVFWASEEVWVKSFLHWFIFNVPIFLMHLFVVEYSILVGVVANRLENLNKNLLNFEEFPNLLVRTPAPLNEHNLPVALTSSTYCSRLAVLELLHNIRTTLSEVSQDIAELFSFPTLPAVACFSLTLVYNFYFLITPIVISSSIKVYPTSANINAAAWILACVYPLILLSLNVARTVKEAYMTRLVVHKLLAKARGREIQKELERFSLQLIHENFNFTAYGFFTLDFTLIQSIFGVTATYLVIVVQFMQSAANTSLKKNVC